MKHITELYLEYISNNESNLLEAKKNKAPVISYQVQYILDKGLATAAVFLPGGVLYFVTRKLYDMYDYKCAVKCYIIKDTKNKSICFKRCNLKSIEDVIKKVQSEFDDCTHTGNPDRCRKRLGKVLLYWKELQIDSEAKLQTKLKKMQLRKMSKVNEQEQRLAAKLLRYIMLMSDDILILANKKKQVIKQKYRNRDEIIKNINQKIEEKKKKIAAAKVKLQQLRSGKK